MWFGFLLFIFVWCVRKLTGPQGYLSQEQGQKIAETVLLEQVPWDRHMSLELPSLLVFYCYVTNCHTFSSLKHFLFHISQFLWTRSLGASELGPELSLLQDSDQGLVRLCSHLEVCLGKDPLLTPIMLLVEVGFIQPQISQQLDSTK